MGSHELLLLTLPCIVAHSFMNLLDDIPTQSPLPIARVHRTMHAQLHSRTCVFICPPHSAENWNEDYNVSSGGTCSGYSCVTVSFVDCGRCCNTWRTKQTSRSVHCRCVFSSTLNILRMYYYILLIFQCISMLKLSLVHLFMLMRKPR